MIGLSARRTWDRVNSGELESYRDGARVLVPREAIEAYVAARRAARRTSKAEAA